MKKLDRVISSIRDEHVDPKVIEDAAARVRSRLGLVEERASAGDGPIESCEGFRRLLAPYLRGELEEKRRLLFEDHSRECVPCRKALKEARTGAVAEPIRVARGSRVHPAWWGVAATFLIVAVLAGAWWLTPPDGPAAAVASVDGVLYRVTDAGLLPLQAGDDIERGDPVRTGRGAGAVLTLRDGSRVEVAERSELSIAERRTGATIELAMGNVIVEAAPQGAGHLDVRTGDCAVSVTGTIFTVNRGTKGSRVSVLEGSVRVTQAGDERLLEPGEQFTSHPSVRQVPLRDEIAWSRDTGRYAAVLAELNALGRELDTVFATDVRHSTALLDRMPAGTVVYAAIPNLSSALDEAYRKLQERVEESDVLREWWENRVLAVEGDLLETSIRQIAALGSYLGDEVVIGFGMDGTGEMRGPILLAEVSDPEGFRAAVRSIASTAGVDGPPLRLLREPGGATALGADDGGENADALVLAVGGGVVVASPGGVRYGSAGSFVGSDFHRRIAGVYADGADWLFAADLGTILATTTAGGPDAEALRLAGILDVEHLIVEARDEGGHTEHRVLLAFDGPRHGIASWLAEPTPMGSLGFVSPDATLAAAFAVKNPSVLVRDIFELAGVADPGALVPRDPDRQLLEDFAASLGGEIAVALDGPLLPVPAWKIVAEVYDPERFQRSMERMVSALREGLRDSDTGSPLTVTLDREEAGGRVYHVLRVSESPIDVVWTFVDGYLVAAPQRAIIDLAIGQRDSGYVLTGSSAFRERMPRDAHPNFSAVVYQALGPALAPLAQRLASTANDDASPDRLAALRSVAQGFPAGMSCAYAEDDRIVLAGSKEGGLGLNLSTFLGFGGGAPDPLGLVLGEALQGVHTGS